MSEPQSLIAEGVSRRFRAQVAVNQASLELIPGKITALVGPSGSGKSTLLRLFAGLERPDTGRILSGDRVLSDARTALPVEKRKIGLVFQDFALFPHLSAVQNVMFGIRGLSKPEQHAAAEAWLDRVGLHHKCDAYPHQLSGGEQQRTAIARALAPRPVAILLDEPFSGLDPSMRDQVREVAIAAIKTANIPALLVTHDASEALVHSDEIAVIDAGEILQTGAPESVYRTPASLAVAKALGPVHSVTAAALPDTWQRQLQTASGTLWYRPEAVQLGDGAEFPILRTRLAGPITEYELALSDTERLFAACQPGTVLRNAETLGVRIDPDLFYDFGDGST